MLQFLFFGRLDREKGRDAIIAMIEHFANKQDGTLPFVLHIFGKGSYESQIVDLAKHYPAHIIYYGFQPLDTIKKTAIQCDYCLMPSLFLETFGLSAVNALSRGLPVIGYQQGGMTPFVLDSYNLLSDAGSPTVHLITMMEKLLGQGRHNDSKKCRDIAGKYSKKGWMHTVNKLIYPTWIATSSEISDSSQGQKKKILLVTDFVDRLGGIETYVHDVAALLREQGHTVEIIGSRGGKTTIGRRLSMALSICNVFFARKLQKKIDAFAPDIIWCHSVLRHIGWLGLGVINKSNATKWMTYHDLGYIAPFPHSIYNEKQIPASLGWADFSKNITNPIQKLWVFGKRCLLKFLWKQLKQFDTHLVPSDFMVDRIAKETDSPIITLSHFIQE